MALYYDDLSVGQKFVTPGRTVTEADVVGFAALSGDWNQIHTDVEFARDTAYGQRVVHGLFGLAMMTGLFERLAIFSGSAIAMLGIREWRFTAPIFIGDTLHGEMEVVALRLTSKGDRGIVDRHYSLVNQRGEITQEGDIGLMIRRSEQAAAA